MLTMHKALERSVEVNYPLIIFLFESWNSLLEQTIWVKIAILPYRTCHQHNSFMAFIDMLLVLK